MQWWRKPESRKRALLALVFVFVCFIWYGVFVHHARDTLRVAFLDVGQGDATLIQTPSGAEVLIDGGRSRSVLRELSALRPFYDRHIDVILATHPDADHIGGLPDVLRRFSVDYVVRSGHAKQNAVTRAFREAIGAEEAEEVIARRGMRIDLGGGAVLDVLFPDRDVSRIDANAASVMARLSYGEHQFLLTGDAPDTIEEYVVALDKEQLEAEVLKVGHHGSDTSSAAALLGFVSPEYAVISAGKDNSYGHPSEDVLARLARFDIQTIGTYEKGAVIFETDGTNLVRVD